MRRIVIAALIIVIVAVPAAAKEKDKVKEKVQEKVQESDRWGSFATYKGARKLCQEHVKGDALEIAWQSYATGDLPAQVVAFYEKDQGKKADPSPGGEFTLHATSRPDDIISIFPAEKTDAYPGCAEKAARTDKTVIVIATAIARSK